MNVQCFFTHRINRTQQIAWVINQLIDCTFAYSWMIRQLYLLMILILHLRAVDIYIGDMDDAIEITYESLYNSTLFWNLELSRRLERNLHETVCKQMQIN